MQKSYLKHFILLTVFLVIFALLNVSLGSVTIPFKEIINICFGGNTSKDSWRTIIINYRLPKTITAILAGSGLSISGLLMQTLFRNTLAGPYVLGISSGASLGVAFLILGSSFLGSQLLINSSFSIALASSIGAFTVLSAVIITANRVRNTMSILIIGLMFGTFSSAIISVLSYFSSAEKLQQFILWSYGSLGNLSWHKIYIFSCIYILGIIGLLLIIKPLNGLLLGENYAKSLGVHINQSRNIILLITSILTGVITAFCGPIAFIGLAVPHISKLLFNTSNHKTLLIGSSILGAILLLICDTVAGVPNKEITLPINAITSILGAPVVIWLLIRQKK